MSLAAFNSILNGPLSIFVRLSADIGGDVSDQAKQVEAAFIAQQAFLNKASVNGAPAEESELAELLKPTSQVIEHIQTVREQMRPSQMFNHLSAISESISALGWVTVSPAPAPYVRDLVDTAQFYTNRVLKEFKEVNKVHVEWTKAWIQVLTELQQFVKMYHTTGLEWGGKSSGAPPPPPAPLLPPPPSTLPPGDAAPLDSATDRASLFAEINRGEAITASLKKVTPDMQTHKNAALRSGPAPFKVPSTSPVTKSVAAPRTIDKPPVFRKDGKKWLVEHQKGNHSLLIEGAEMNNQVYMFNCEDSTLVIKGKLNTVIVDSCKKTSVVFDTLVASMEFVNCQSVQMQVFEKVPTISIDKTDGCQLYLSPNSMDVSIISSKSSEMNVMVPKGNGDYGEYPVPEQFRTTVTMKGLSTVPLDSLA